MTNSIKIRFTNKMIAGAVVIGGMILGALLFTSTVMARTRVDVTDVCVSSTEVTLAPGGSYQITAYVIPDNATDTDVYFYSSDPNVATVDQNGIIRAISNGACTIIAETDDGGYEAHTCVRVNGSGSAVIQPASADDQAWLSSAANIILTVPDNSGVSLTASYPVSLDLNVVNALQMRPDVEFMVTFPYNGQNCFISIPAGYNLTAHLDSTAHVSLLTLAAANDGCVTVMTAQQ